MPVSHSAPTRRRRWSYIGLVPIFALLALIAWAVSSPIGSSPDDDYHLPSIWCGLGDRPGICETVPGHPDQRAVPNAIADSKCNIKILNVQCRTRVVPPPGTMTPTMRGNFEGIYPPVYYSFMSIFVTPNVAASVIGMRIVNAVLFVGITTLLYLLLAPSRRRTLLWTWAIGIVPLGAFLVASNNPSAWAVIAGGSLWLSLVGYFESQGRRAIWLGVLSVVLAVMGAGARADSALYTVGAVIVAGILTAERTRAFLLKAILPAALVIVGVFFYLTAGQSAVASSGFGGGSGGKANPVSMSSLLWNNLLNLPSLWAGNLGTWGLGWLDTPMPAIVSVTCIALFGGVTFAGLRSASTRKLLALGAVTLALIVVPMWALYVSRALVGFQIQPRYIFPLLLMFAGVALLSVRGRPITFSRLQVGVVAVGIAIANSAALHINLRRYISGLQVTDPNLNHFVTWWWHVPITPMVVWVVGSLAFGVAIWLALWYVAIRTPRLEALEEPAEPVEPVTRPVAAV
ncbi:DUF2142 domain-containing protein [Leifsonia sp. NPDC058248]|uniref:DUF2142 domain-containing protein n=1 Tax=Leifsonia sp. NPDC058248 TaxID=3346402 RepID=UPI0036D8C6E7